MKRDGRTLDHKTLEEIRRMAVQRVWEGEKPSVVIASYGFSRQIIYKWLREAKSKGRGLRALRSRKATGRPRTLTAKQEQQLFRWINGKDPPAEKRRSAHLREGQLRRMSQMARRRWRRL